MNAPNQLIVEVVKLPPDGARIEGELSSAVLELENDRLLHVSRPVRYDLHAQVVSRELIVQGSIAVDLEIECGRCTELFSTTLADSSFLRAYEVPEGTESVDVTADIREDILLELPLTPLCSPSCKGLCPRCGKNRNEGPCSCKSESPGDGPWNVFDGLKLPDDK